MSKYPIAASAIIQGVILFTGCLGLFGCSEQTAQQQNQVSNTPAAQADQAAWQLFTKQAEEALAKKDKASAEKYYRLAIAEAEKLGADTPAVASSTANLADFYYVQGDGGQADELYKRSLAVFEKTKGTQHIDLVKDLIGLGKVSILKKQGADAVTYFQRAQDIVKGSGLPEQPDITSGLADAKKLTPAAK